MTKLEEKLQELGYEYDGYDYTKILKIKLLNLNYPLSFTLRIKVMDNAIIKYYGHSQSRCFKEDISNAYKQAFNEMQKDLAILKEIEKDELEL